ncbi:MAG: hypothetical protein ABR499_20415 [Gemmatimonadaceae bacterium]
MRFRFSTACALGLAAALLAVDGSSSYVQAQAPTDTAAARRRAAARRAAARRAAARRAAAARSDVAIPTTGKEVPVQVRVDTVFQVRSDTVFRMRTDTVTVSRTDTVTVQQSPVFPTVRMGGFYWGLGGGLTAPRQQLNTTFEPGFNVTGMLGWDPIGSPFGVRFDVAYDQFSERSQYAALAADPSILSAHLNGKLRFPLYGVETGGRAELYAVGGGSYYRHKNLLFGPERATTAQVSCGEEGESPTAGNCDEWSDDFGWNLGGGVGFGFGPSNVFLEARWMGVGSNRSFVPIIIGLTF